MASLIRTLHYLQSDNAYGMELSKRASSGPPEHWEPVEGSLRNGFIAMGVIALCSFVASFGLLSFLTYRMIFWRRYYKRPLSDNQYVVLIYNLLLIDCQQAMAFMISLHWVHLGRVKWPSAACYLQGWWIQTGDPGSGLFVMAIAFHTAAVVLRGQQLPYNMFIGCIIGLWIFILVLGFIPIGLFGHKVFVISEAGWCWLSQQHETERLWVHYLWIFIAEFGTVVLYAIMFFYLQRRMRQAAQLRQHHQENLKRLNRVVIYMVVYPLAYLVLSLPLAAGRMSTARHIPPSQEFFAAAGALMGLSGLVDVAVYTLTRRHLLMETEHSETDKMYAYSESNAYQTHITTGRGGKGLRHPRFRKGLQSINDTVDDDRDDSTEDIVRKGNFEMAGLGHGVYQETTIEISSEPADAHPPKEEDRSSG